VLGDGDASAAPEPPLPGDAEAPKAEPRADADAPVMPPLTGGIASDAPAVPPQETTAPDAPAAQPEQPATPAAPAVQATKEVAMIVPNDVKADRKIEFVVDDVKYSAVLPDGLKAGDTFRARIPCAAPPVAGPTADGAVKRPAAEESKPAAKKQKAQPKKKREVQSEDEDDDEEEDDNAGQELVAPEERISARLPRRASRGNPAEDASAKAWGEHVTPGGIRYWYNTMTGLTSWDKPRGWVPGQKPVIPAPATAAAAAAAPAAADAPKTSSGKDDGEDLLAAIGN